MPEKILTIDNSTFFVTCRIGEKPQDVQDMQWFLVGDSQNLLADQTCQYILNGIQYEKMLCFLSGDLVTLLNRNSFDRLDVCDIYGNAKDAYTKKRSEK